MKVFLSWSGERSKAVAEALAVWLRQVIQVLNPWKSTDLGAGVRWGSAISAQLEETRVGIICITRENLEEPWLLFEAGALSKTKDALVCTFLLDLAPGDVKQPLGQFQHTTAGEGDVRKLLHTLNEQSGSTLTESDINDLFVLHWPRLKEKLAAIPAANVPAAEPVRSAADMLREILEEIRSLRQPPASVEVFDLTPAQAQPPTTLLSRRYKISLAGMRISREQLEAVTAAIERQSTTMEVYTKIIDEKPYLYVVSRTGAAAAIKEIFAEHTAQKPVIKRLI